MGVALSGGRDDDFSQKNFFYLTRTYAFRGEEAWRPPDDATPILSRGVELYKNWHLGMF